MKRVLFISRHELLPKQEVELKKRIGNYELIQDNRTFKSSRELINYVEVINPDYIIPILPLPMIIDLLEYIKKNGKKWVIIKPKMELVERFYDKPVYGDDIVCLKMIEDGVVKYRVYKFLYWVILKEIIIKEVPLI